jgi:uncharacterized protein (DUF488 family)
MNISTLGYEGLDTDSFFDILESNNIETLIDVRENPISRKKGFSKNSLSRLAEEAGIRYVHIPELGSPRKIRNLLKENKDWLGFSIEYIHYVQTQVEGLDNLMSLILDSDSCLMCFEANPELCHRSLLIEVMNEGLNTTIKVVHLKGEKDN